MVSVTINKFDVDWEVEVSMWLEGSTVFLSFLGEIYFLDTEDVFEDDVTEEELVDCYFSEFEGEVSCYFTPPPVEEEMSDYEFYKMKF